MGRADADQARQRQLLRCWSCPVGMISYAPRNHTHPTTSRLQAQHQRLLPLTGLSSGQFQALLFGLAEPEQRGRPWSLPLPARLLLALTALRTNLTTRALAAVFGVS